MRTPIITYRDYWLRNRKTGKPLVGGIPASQPLPTAAQNPVQPDLPHANLIVDPVLSWADAQQNFLAEQIVEAKDLQANDLMPQTHAELMSKQAARDAGAIPPAPMADPLGPNPIEPKPPEPRDFGPTPYMADPMKPPGM